MMTIAYILTLLFMLISVFCIAFFIALLNKLSGIYGMKKSFKILKILLNRYSIAVDEDRLIIIERIRQDKFRQQIDDLIKRVESR